MSWRQGLYVMEGVCECGYGGPRESPSEVFWLYTFDIVHLLKNSVRLSEYRIIFEQVPLVLLPHQYLLEPRLGAATRV